MSEGTEGETNPQAESALDKMARGMTEETGAWVDIPQGDIQEGIKGVHRRETHSYASTAK
jgi:hypothetical protein